MSIHQNGIHFIPQFVLDILVIQFDLSRAWPGLLNQAYLKSQSQFAASIVTSTQIHTHTAYQPQTYPRFLDITDLLFRSTVTMSRHATLTWHVHTTQFVASVGFYPHTKNQRCTLILQSSNMTVSNILKSDCSKPFRNFQFRQTFNLWWKVKSYKNFQMTKYRTPYFVILCLNIRAKMNFQPKLDFVSFYILK